MKDNNNDEIPLMNINEFRTKGYLQEINRQFLHPLGLALTILIDTETMEEHLAGVMDYRNDDEGMLFGINDKPLNQERIDIFNNNKSFIESELTERSQIRQKKLGFIIEPIPNINS